MIDQSAQSELSSAQVIYYSEQLFSYGEMVAATNGSNNINDSRYLMSIDIHPYDDHETIVYKSTIAYLMEENKRLKKQMRKLTREYY